MKAAVFTLALMMSMSSVVEAQRVKLPESVRLYQEAQGRRLNAERFTKSKAFKEAKAERATAREQLLKALKLAPDFVDAAEALSGLLTVMRKHVEAIKVLKRALEHSPSALTLKNELGIHLFRLRRFDEGEKLLIEVTKKPGRFLTAHYTLAAHYYREEAWTKALPHAQAYLRKRPNDATVHGLLGNVALRTHKLQLALDSFKTVLRLDRTNIAVQVNLGSVFYELKDYKRAIAQFQAVLEMRPDIGLIHNNLGNCFFELRKWRSAADHYLSFIQVEPGNALGHYRAGLSLFELNENDNALRLLARAAELDPGDPWAPYKMAQIAMRQGHLDLAEQFAGQAEKRRPEDSRILVLVGQIARRQKNYVRAISVFERALEVDADNGEIYAELGYALILAGQSNSGIVALQAGYARAPKNQRIKRWLATALIHRGVTQLRGGAVKGAEKDFRRALSVDRAQVDAAWNLVLLLDRLHRTKEALGVVSSALKWAPKSPDLHLALAFLFVRQDRAPEAQKALMRAKGAHDVAMRWLVQGAIHAMFAEYDAAVSAFGDAKKRGLEPRGALFTTRLSHAAHLINNAHYRAATNLLKRLRAPLNHPHRAVRDALLALTYLNLQTRFERIPALLERVRKSAPSNDWGLALFRRDIALISGYTHYRLGNNQLAQQQLEIHRKKAPTDIRGKRLLAQVLEQLAERDYVAHRFASAAHRIRRALALTPGSKRLIHNLACVRYSRGEHVEASRVFAKLHAEGAVAEATLNLALYMDDVMGLSGRASSLYKNYLKQGGIASEVARRRIRRKERIFGK